MYENVCLFYSLGMSDRPVVEITRRGKTRKYYCPTRRSLMRLAFTLNKAGCKILAWSYGWEAYPPEHETE